LFKSVLVAYAFVRSESFDNLNFIATELGIASERITIISDDCDATRLLARTHGWEHFLCQWHYAANYVKHMKRCGVNFNVAKFFNDNFFRLLKGIDFDSSDAFTHCFEVFCDALVDTYPGMTSWVSHFRNDKSMVCEIFRKVFVAGAHTTQRNESIHSLIKMGNLLANALREMSFHGAYSYINNTIDLLLEQSLDSLSKYLERNRFCCDKVLEIMSEANSRCVDTCMDDSGWNVHEVNVLPADAAFPASRSCEKSSFYRVKSTSGQITVTHWVCLSPDTEYPIWCSCHDFTSLEITCVGIAAAIKKRKENPCAQRWVNQNWLLSFHPLYLTAIQRSCPSLLEGLQHPQDEGHEHCDSSSNLERRWQLVQSIPVPTTPALRRSKLMDAFNSLRDDFSVPMHVPKFRAVMASINDLRASFSNSDTWVRAPSIDTDCPSIPAWSGHRDSTPAPANLAVVSSKRVFKGKQAQMPIATVNKLRIQGKLPTIEDRRQQKEDWTLYMSAGRGETWMCPIRGCTPKPIRNTDQARYAHRKSSCHRNHLIRYPSKDIHDIEQERNADAVGAGMAPGIPAEQEQVAESGIPDEQELNADVVGAESGIPDEQELNADVVGAESGIPDEHDSCRHEVSDSYRRDVEDAYRSMEWQEQEKGHILSPIEKCSLLGTASINVSAARSAVSRQNSSELMVKRELVEAPATVLAGLHTDCMCKGIFYNMKHKADELQALLRAHAEYYQKMKSFPNHSRELPEGLFVVECGLNGDCFFHSLAWLNRLSIAGHTVPAFCNSDKISLAALHVPMRLLIQEHLQQCAGSMAIDKAQFGTLDDVNPTLEHWIECFEHQSLQEYTSQHSLQHQFAGLPELVAWASWSNRPIVLIHQGDFVATTTYVPTSDSSVIMAYGWENAAHFLEQGSFCLLQTNHHYMAVVPWHRLAFDCPPSTLTDQKWAHYTSRPIMNNSKHLEKMMPIVKLHTCNARRPNQ
jgi:hypothetical protein